MPTPGTKAVDSPPQNMNFLRSVALRIGDSGFWQNAEWLGCWLDARPALLIVVLLASYGLATIPHALFRPMWHDELITYYLAISPSVRQMMSDVPRLDLNPPLLYLLDYAMVRLPGAHANEHLASLAARLPSLLAGLLASLGLFALVRSRLGSLYALAAVAFLWKTEFLRYTWEDRPYALMFALLILLILVWERATRSDRHWLWTSAVFLVALAMMSSHFFASFLLLAFVAAELGRAWINRRLDPWMLSAFVLPFGIPLAYKYMLSAYGKAEFPAAFQVTFGKLGMSYVSLLDACATILAPILVFCLFATILPRSKGVPQKEVVSDLSCVSPLTRPEWILLLGILAEPVVAGFVIERMHGAFFERYGLPACVSMVVLLLVFLFWRFNGVKRVALIVVIASCIDPMLQFARHPLKYLVVEDTPSVVGSSSASYRTVDPELPLVDASVLTFVEMNHRESPDLLRRTYFLTDRTRALRYAHATMWESEADVGRILHFQGKISDYLTFKSEHPHFLVLGTYNHPEEWLLRTLVTEGNTVRYLGTFNTSYIDKDLYEVTVRPQP